MAKLVARMIKLKSDVLTQIENHNKRKTENHKNKEIDKSLSCYNFELVEKPKTGKKQIIDFINKNKKSEKAVRSDAVVISEWVITSNQEFFKNLTPDQTSRFFKIAKGYFERKFGKDNVAYATVHMDETTPHMHLGIIPLNPDGSLSAKKMFDRKMLLFIQEDLPKYLKQVGFEIERGEQKSAAEHLSVDEFKIKKTFAAARETVEKLRPEKFEDTIYSSPQKIKTYIPPEKNETHEEYLYKNAKEIYFDFNEMIEKLIKNIRDLTDRMTALSVEIEKLKKENEELKNPEIRKNEIKKKQNIKIASMPVVEIVKKPEVQKTETEKRLVKKDINYRSR